MHAVRLRSIRPALACAGLLVAMTGCRRAPTTPPPATEPTPAAVAAPATAAKPSCRDWSTLDLATLEPLPPGPHVEMFDQVWRTILSKHYDVTLGCKDWPALRTSYGAKVAAAKDETEAYRLTNALLGELGQSHLGVIPPRGAAAAEPGQARPRGPGRIPVALALVGDTVAVRSPSWQGGKTKIPAGAVVVAIDDKPLDAMRTGIAEAFTREVERDFHLLRSLDAALSCAAGESHTLTWSTKVGGPTKTTKARCHVPKPRTISFGNLQDIPVEVEAHMVPGTKVGVIAFNVWLLPLVDDIRKGLAELRAQGMQALVFDLRGNPGGVGPMVIPVGRLVFDRAADLGVMHMRGAEQRFHLEAGEDPFLGPVAILVDAGTASTSEIFAQSLLDLGRAKVVGTSASQGAALPSLIERLPSGALLQYVVADYVSPSGREVEGAGVSPDPRVELTLEALAAGRDPVLDAAVALLTSAPSTSTPSK